jgi:Helix-turn-helix domain
MTEQLKRLRQASQREPAELAAAAGITLDEYYDLETYEDELATSAPVGAVARLAAALGVRPSSLLGVGSASQSASFDELVTRVRHHVAASGGDVQAFETEVGWKVEAALDNPEELLDFTADALRAICSIVGLDWVAVLDTIEP